ncbi:hypothetical protein BSPWISOXPB_7380 [uncultured Gammaproteobacteria bacterium]|nr:hypothetical protein BSPWISOXPB_7380 [uncultured Gammaproteobacteria bacterium]
MFCVGVKLGSVKALARAGLLAILAVTAFIGFVEFVYFTEEVFEFCSIGIDYLLDGRGYHA